jgi:hypothetical protein
VKEGGLQLDWTIVKTTEMQAVQTVGLKKICKFSPYTNFYSRQRKHYIDKKKELRWQSHVPFFTAGRPGTVQKIYKTLIFHNTYRRALERLFQTSQL